ncbi:MAG: hypothetical protein WC401_09795 [Bacteroidales bacterium]|jgi:hypothetical protein
MRHKDKYKIDEDEMPMNKIEQVTAKEETVQIGNSSIRVNSQTISLNQYLSFYNRKRVLDNVIRKWFMSQDKTNPKKTKQEWEEIINRFHNETEK